MTNREYLEQACIMYIRCINVGMEMESARVIYHSTILRHLWILRDKLITIFHNLDVYIDYDIYNSEKNNAVILGKKLLDVLCEEAVKEIKQKYLCRVVREEGITFDEWLDLWKENMEFDEKGTPVLKLAKEVKNV